MDNECTFITGAAGLVGSHLIEYLHKKKTGINIVATYYRPTIRLSDIKAPVKMVECDVRYFSHLYMLIDQYRPNIIFHLAAQSYPTVSWERPAETMEINAIGTINLFEAIKFLRKKNNSYNPTVIVACSSAEYGASLTPENIPVKEITPLLPLHPYGVSKVCQDLLSFQYFANDGIKAIRARIFNTTGPRKINDVVSDFTKRAVLVKRRIEKKIKVGNLNTSRAILDVRDLVVALVLLAEKGKPGEVYNISGEKVYRVSEILDIIQDILKIELPVEIDENLLRPVDEAVIFGDSSKLKHDTGWEQKIPLQETISDMINYWEDILP
ncbi:MAG: GDP-mannose 4,6-dehydratase [Patescibacteria group bacterium]|nr:GDP-mannose 4,6-dehydratase [Patescibacteria group bacterium]